MMKKITFYFCLVIMSIMSQAAFAVPAVPWPVEKIQPDGTKISVYIRGDEKVHWFESLDGYTLMYDSNKYLAYAEQDAKGSLVPSKVRLSKSNAPKSLQKGLRYSAEQVNTLQQIWGVDKGPQKAFLGSKKVFMVLMDFSDRQMVKSQADFDALMNQVGYTAGGAKGSVRDFYLENSYNQLTLEVTVAGPYRADYPAAHYPGLGNGYSGRALANEAVNKADADGVDFSEFAVNGLVETFHVIFAGYGAETGLSSSQYI
ncbi:MAG: immune inhibitor A, partial [Dysgonamonadaceae bacterium]|nr:immune inhibitor A [Dysgonamonadaceae bacterium]